MTHLPTASLRMPNGTTNLCNHTHPCGWEEQDDAAEITAACLFSRVLRVSDLGLDYRQNWVVETGMHNTKQTSASFSQLQWRQCGSLLA